MDSLPPATVDLADVASFDFVQTENLRFADLDAHGHVNNVAFLVFFENVRVRFVLDRLRAVPALAGLEVVAARLEIDYRRQMFYPGSVRAGARLIEIRRSAVVIGQAIFDQGGACAATGKVVLVSIDRASGKSRPIPDAARAALESLMPGATA